MIYSGRRPGLPSGPYAVAGLRQAGLAAVDALLKHRAGAEIVAYDHYAPSLRKRDRRRLEAAGVKLRLGEKAAELCTDPAPEVLIKSPGIPLDAPLIRAAQRRGLLIIDEVELAWRMSRVPMVGVTGTNGKTTVATLITDLLVAGGCAAVLAGNATNGPALSAADQNADWIVCELSSFQLEGCPALMPEIAVFTNLSYDHISRHGTMRNYGDLKRRLFIRDGRVVPVAVINVADAFGRALSDEVQAGGGHVVRVGLDEHADYRVRGARWDLHSAIVALSTPTGEVSLSTRLPGSYNAHNVAAAVALSDLFGIDRARVAKVLAAHPGAPGRLERLRYGQPHELVIDNASSPASVRHVLETLACALPPGRRLYAVLGVVGSPDSTHLRRVGRAAAQRCDRLYLTSGSLRSSPPIETIEGLRTGARDGLGASVEVVPRRRTAMEAALASARSGDVVVVLGRGDLLEPVKDHHIDDRTVLRELVVCGSS